MELSAQVLYKVTQQKIEGLNSHRRAILAAHVGHEMLESVRLQSHFIFMSFIEQMKVWNSSS